MNNKTALLLSFVLALFSSCSLIRKEKAIEVNPDLIIGYFPSSDLIPFYLAQQQGYFDSLQLNIRLQRMESKFQCDTLYRTGKIDGCIFELTDALRMSAEGNTIHPIMGNEGCFYLLGNPDSTITTIEQLKNKTVAINNYSSADYLTDKLFAKHDLTEEDVNKPEIGNDYIRLEMMLNTQVEAAVFQEPYASSAISQKAVKLYDFNALNEITTVTAFSQPTLEKKKDLLIKLITAYNRAVNFMNTHTPDAWFDEVADSIGWTQTKNLTKITSYHQARILPQATVDSVANWMKRKKLIPDNYKADIVDRSLLQSFNLTSVQK